MTSHRRSVNGHTLTPYRRHTKECVEIKGDATGVCDCPIWVRGRVTPDADPIRQSLNTTDPEKAHVAIGDLARGIQPPVKGLTVAAAMQMFRAEREDGDLGLAAGTLKSDRFVFGAFVKGCGNITLANFTSVDLKTYRRDVRRVAENTWRTDLIKLGGFFAWCASTPRRWIDEIPTNDVAWPAQKKLCTPPFEREEVDRLKAACDGLCANGLIATQGKFKLHSRRRARALVLTLLYTGLRISDICRLKRSALNVKTRYVVLRTMKSGDKTQVRVRVPQECVDALMKLPPIGKSPYFFWSGDGELPVSGLAQTLKRLGKLANVEDVHPHRFRDTFATELLSGGADIRAVQLLLGHMSVETTEEFYAHFINRHQELLDRATDALSYDSGREVGGPVLVNTGNR